MPCCHKGVLRSYWDAQGCTPDVFFSFVSDSAEPQGLDVGNGTVARREAAPPLCSFLSAGRFTSFFPLGQPSSSAYSSAYWKPQLSISLSQEKWSFGRHRSFAENWFERGRFAGPRWGIQTTSSFCWGYLPLCLRTGTRQPSLELLSVVPAPTGCLQQIFR